MNSIKNHSIKSYWQATPELFSEKYEWNITHFFSPTSLFLDARRRKVVRMVGNSKNKKILDVGCGSGIFMLSFIKKGAEVVGVDYSQKMLNLAKHLFENYKIPKRRFNLIKCKASEIKFRNKSFDVILATGLTDYIPREETETFLSKSSKILKNNGLLIVSFPSTESPFAFLRKGLGLEIRQKFFHLPPIASTFTEKEIKQLLERRGFKIGEICKIYSAMWLVKAVNKQKS